MQKADQVKAVREAGYVERCHGMRKIGHYSVAEHTYGVVSLLLLLHPGPSLRLIRAAQWHDSAERWTGDIPSPAKWAHAGLAQGDSELELDVLNHIGIKEHLDEEEECWLRACDMLEFWLWMQEQLHMGNSTLEPLNTRLGFWWESRADRMPAEVMEIVRNYNPDRLPDCDEFLGRKRT